MYVQSTILILLAGHAIIWKFQGDGCKNTKMITIVVISYFLRMCAKKKKKRERMRKRM
jgi:hypothetical protein